MRQPIEIDIVELAFTGKAIGYIDGKVTFVNGGLPGETVLARVVKSRKTYNQAKMIRILKHSPERIDPICEHNELCGGCTWQDLTHDRQIYYKRQQIVNCIEHIGHLTGIEVGDVTPSPDLFFYRNKMEYSFNVADLKYHDQPFVLGLHERGRFDRIFNINKCHLQSDLSNRLVHFVRQQIEELDIPVYDLINHTGLFRFLIIREGKNTDQSMVVLVTGGAEFDAKEQFVNNLKTSFPELTTAVWMVNDTITNIAKGDIREIFFGPGFIEEEILGYKFQISPGSFFQTNSRQTEALYKKAIELAEIKPDDTVLDLYCGAGTIGICASAFAASVVGIELEAEAVASAVENVRINNIQNCRFHAGSVRKVLKENQFEGLNFDPVFIDPPRAGLHPKALKRILEIEPKRLIYISCNPSTFARDAADLVAGGYRFDKVTPFDMFPHTMHVELIARFDRAD